MRSVEPAAAADAVGRFLRSLPPLTPETEGYSLDDRRRAYAAAHGGHWSTATLLAALRAVERRHGREA